MVYIQLVRMLYLSRKRKEKESSVVLEEEKEILSLPLLLRVRIARVLVSCLVVSVQMKKTKRF